MKLNLLIIGVLISAVFQCSTPAENTSTVNIPTGKKQEPKIGPVAQQETNHTRIGSIPAPEGFTRTNEEAESFAVWLRQLPLKPPGNPVLLYNGERKGNQSAHYAVVDLPIGRRDLHQCADAVMRLKAEYHFEQKSYDDIHFKYTSGDEVRYEDWVRGKRPKVSGSRVSFSSANQAPDYSYSTFWKYLENIFTYAGTASLTKELQSVDVSAIRVGDVFIQGGFPGHAVIVVDMVKNDKLERKFLLAQSYMPAQEIHVLKNPKARNPWYSIPKLHEELVTPEWIFNTTDLKRFE